MEIGQLIRFHNERFFEGAVQLSWVQRRIEQARQAAEAFVFHGPRYHGAGKAESDGVEGAYKLKDTASFVRDLLGSLQAGAEGRDVNPYWLVVAGYGSGKSHLALTCSMLLSEPQGQTTQIILDQITRADAEIGETVARQVAEMGKPALMLPLDGMAGFHLGNALSRAVFEQLHHHGVDADVIRELSPRFQTAEQFVLRNFAVRKDSFARCLPAMDAEQIAARLRENDEAVYTEVDAIYAEANGLPIPIEGQESAQALIDTLCNVYCAPDGPFSHLVILFDELGRYLEYAAEKPQLAGDFALQQIFQGVQDNSAKVRFVGFIQYELKAYLKRFGGADLRQLQRYITRFDTADKWYLSTNLETIFAHMIGKDEQALQRLWQQTGAQRQIRQTWQYLSASLPGFSRYSVWSDAERFERIIALGCWPLHPFAVWFLTRQRDLVQSRSALTFIKDVIERIAPEEADVNGRLRQVSAAELVIDSMLPELISAERETGGSTAETLQMLLDKFSGHLDNAQQRLLAGVAVIEKTRIGKQPKALTDKLLCEATALAPTTLPKDLDGLFELGALEWNDDLGQYELLSDGATRGQFQQWLRAQLTGLAADGVRDLFVRRGTADIEVLGDITSDFAQSHQISTRDWIFEAQLAHTNTVDKTIIAAFAEWRKAISPKEAKGKLIYLYLHADDDVVAVAERIRTVMGEALLKQSQRLAPIWVIGIVDSKGTLAEHIGRLYLFDEKMSVGDTERFRRFISTESDRSRRILKDEVSQALKQRLFWVAGFSAAPAGRLRVVARDIFNQVYPRTIPFPFDGFATANGGGAMDAAQLARGLIARQVDGNWVTAQPRRLQNRVHTLLMESWQALLPSGRLGMPNEPSVRALCELLEQHHKNDPQRTLLISYHALIAPPFGFNASSAGLLLGLLLALDSPPRRVEYAGVLVASSEWIGLVFPSKKGKHHLDEAILKKSRLRFLSEDSTGRWRTLLSRWEAEQDYSEVVKIARAAEEMRKDDPLPETLEGNYSYLRDKSDRADTELLEIENKIGQWERGIEKAERRASIDHAIRLGGQVLRKRKMMEDSPHWPSRYIDECNSLLGFIHEQISYGISDWILTQNCHSFAQLADFRHHTERATECLAELGFHTEAKTLQQQVQQSIYKVEKLQQFGLTLARCGDYPRQPEPTDSTPVRDLRDEIALGDKLITGVQSATAALSQQEISAHIHAITLRQEKLRVALKRQQDALGVLYGLELNGQEALQEALTKVNRLRDIFVDTRDESEVNDLVIQLEYILEDTESWGIGDHSVDALEELLTYQSNYQLDILEKFLDSKEIESAWDMTAIYQALLNERLDAARRRSTEWVMPRMALGQRLASLEREPCAALERELGAAPAYLSTQDRAQVERLFESVKHRRALLNEKERSAKVVAWQQGFSNLLDLSRLDRHETERLLRELQNPPCELKPDELAQVAPVIDRLLAYLDQMSVDELAARIERLSQAQQRLLFDWLSSKLGSSGSQ